MSETLAVQPGDRAPDFTLQASSGEEITLSTHNISVELLSRFRREVCRAELLAQVEALA